MTMIKYHGLSSAIFAPGWTHECSSTPQEFVKRDTKFWSALEELVYLKGLLIEDAFDIDLNPGSGVKDDKYWLDLCCQSEMPCFNINYELICDIKVKEGQNMKFAITATSCNDGDENVTEDPVLELIFDEENPMQIKSTRKLEKTWEFNCINLSDRKSLHFIKVLYCSNITNFKLSFIDA